MGLLSTTSRPTQCPHCGVEDEKNGIFCYSCGAQIVFTSHGSMRRPRKRHVWIYRWLSAGFIAVAPLLGALYMIGADLPFCTVLTLGLRVETESGQVGTGGEVPSFANRLNRIFFRTTYLFTPPRSVLSLKLFRAGSTQCLWKTNASASYLFGRLRVRYDPGAGPVPPGRYDVQLSYKSKILEKRTFVIQ